MIYLYDKKQSPHWTVQLKHPRWENSIILRNGSESNKEKQKLKCYSYKHPFPQHWVDNVAHGFQHYNSENNKWCPAAIISIQQYIEHTIIVLLAH